MIKSDERKPHVEGRQVDMVSSAVWPVKMRKGVATGKAAQRRRDWIMQGRWWIILVDALSMRLLLIFATLLVVSTSLLVALLGLHFWYLLPFPLLLFALLLIVPALLVSRKPLEIAGPPLPFAQEMRSSAGILSSYAHELRSEPGLLTGDGPATPMPVAQPLVRVLETYDLRATQIKHFLGERPADTLDNAEPMQYLAQSFWECPASAFPQGSNLPCSQVGPGPAPLATSCPGELAESQEEHELSPGSGERE